MEETDGQLNEIEGVTSVHARFYELASNYYRTVGNHFEYYKNALRYLGCVKYETLSDTEKQERAFYLSLAAVLGDGIYNFGELVSFLLNLYLQKKSSLDSHHYYHQIIQEDISKNYLDPKSLEVE